MSKALLVTGATGKQGGAVVDSIIKSKQASDFTILAVTRDPSSASAQKLASKSPLIKIIKGDFADIPALFTTASQAVGGAGIWGVYSVQVFFGKGQDINTEQKYGKAMVDASVKAGVKHFVYSSVDRGGDDASWTQPTTVPHFASKHAIELHLREKAGNAMGWTILRPTAFMDNFEPGYGVKIWLSMLKSAIGNNPLQLIATRDIGIAGARAFLDPVAYNHRAVGLAGDSLTVDQMLSTIGNQTGSNPGYTFSFVSSLVKKTLGHDMNEMMKFFGDFGYGVNVTESKKEFPLLSFKDWLATESKFPKA